MAAASASQACNPSGARSLTILAKVALFRGQEPVQALAAGEEGQVVLDATPFYAESGGQVGDRGVLSAGDARFAVTDTRKLGRVHLHVGRLESGALRVNDTVEAVVDHGLRQATRLNHSATHLLHAALRKVLGTHVTQKGSLVAPDRLRFDFSHMKGVSAGEIAEIEKRVNAVIRQNNEVKTRIMPYDDAVASGAIALFGEVTFRVTLFFSKPLSPQGRYYSNPHGGTKSHNKAAFSFHPPV